MGKRKGEKEEKNNRPETAGMREREEKEGGESSSEVIPLRLFQVYLIYS